MAECALHLPAGPPEVQGVVHIVLDFEQDVQHHRTSAAVNRNAQVAAAVLFTMHHCAARV